jgi:adenylate kinase family enzyme
VEFSPIYKPLKTQYMTEIPLQIKNTTKVEVLHCMGQSSYQVVHINPSYMELDPILPSAEFSTIIPFIVQNISEKPIEIYSLDFDPQYLLEDQILRDCQKYDEDGIMHLKVREAGEPFWDNLLNEIEDESNKSPSNIFEIGPIIIIYGAPFCGKTTQGRLIAKRYKCPIVDVQDLIVTAIDEGNLVLPTPQGANSFVNDDEVLQSLTPYIPPEALPNYMPLLQTLFEACLKQPGCNNGIIFDGLNSNHIPVLILIKCILNTIGLEQVKEAIVVSPIDEDNLEKIETNIVWKGEKLVHIVKLKARKRRLYHRYLDLEDQHHACVRKYEWPLPKNNNLHTKKESIEGESKEFGEIKGEGIEEVNVDAGAHQKNQPQKSNKIEPKFEIIDGVEIDTNLLIPPAKFNMPYPWYLAFPSPEEVDRYYNTEEEILKEFGIPFQSSKEEIPKTMLVLTIVDSMQDEKKIYEEIIISLPMPWDHDIYCPHPETFQVLRKPPIRKLNEDPNLPFSFITKEREGPPSHIQGHTNPPLGYVTKTRWVIPGNESIELGLVFWSTIIEEFEYIFKFEVLGGQGHATLEVQGICDIPRLQLQQVIFPSKKLQISPCHGVIPRHPRVLTKIPNQIIDFGPINTKPLPAEFPNILDTKHCYRIEVENTGQFDLHVKFQLVKDDVGGPSPIPSEQSVATTSITKKGTKLIPPSKGVPASGSGEGNPFVLHPAILDIKLDERGDLCIYSYPAMVKNFIKLLMKNYLN